jgi:hypothetical protein
MILLSVFLFKATKNVALQEMYHITALPALKAVSSFKTFEFCYRQGTRNKKIIVHKQV